MKSKLKSIEKQKKYKKKLRVEKKIKWNEQLFIKKYNKKKEQIELLYWKLTETALEKTRLKYERKMELRLTRERRKLEKKRLNKKRTIKWKEEKEDTTVSPWKKKLDQVFSKFIRLRDHNICLCCWTDKNPTNGHLFSRVANATRFDETNCNCQCMWCNMEHENNPEIYKRKFISKFWQEEYDRIWKLWNTTVKFDVQRYKEKIVYYKNKVKELTTKNNL